MLHGTSVTPSCDLWALGCILYNMLTGSTPFRCASEFLTFQAIIGHCEENTPIDFPDTVDEMTKDLINKLLMADPSQRLGGGGDADRSNNMQSLKNHEYFAETGWSDLVHVQPLWIPDPSTFPSTNSADMHDGAHDEWFLEGEATIIDASDVKRRSLIAEQNKRNSSEDTQNKSKWQSFFEQDEQLVFTGVIWKRKVLQ